MLGLKMIDIPGYDNACIKSIVAVTLSNLKLERTVLQPVTGITDDMLWTLKREKNYCAVHNLSSAFQNTDTCRNDRHPMENN